ncbi:DNA methyltransferase [Hylemonella gracilis str. Niagara R]|uniref:DNA methyltransferase n=1 Tax=Hylemonella gracilis str. Niagara R TaxID=1458275 RepID=A0A016XHQ6_9BURK|nr:DNA adenine methylase [Hylemonella gracilis]EYC51440.1 DNA methyltransferase [Hylemonella gracilis str. Niagara R]
MTEITRPALRYHGAKFRLAPWLLQFMPTHRRYVESFGGAAGVLIRKPRSHAEVYNDLDGEVASFFRILRNPETRAQLIEAVALTPYSRAEFDAAYLPADEPIEQARRLAVRAMMGFGSAGATKGVTGFRSDTARNGNISAHIWAQYPDNLAAVGLRFEGVLIENRDAISVMQGHDCPQTLHLVDPPYVIGERSMRASSRYYRHEMTDAQHSELLRVVQHLQGRVMVCGYDSELYSDTLTAARGWSRRVRQVAASGPRGSVERTECVWLSPALMAALNAGTTTAPQLELLEIA